MFLLFLQDEIEKEKSLLKHYFDFVKQEVTLTSLYFEVASDRQNE
jgi:hypothetical protein